MAKVYVPNRSFHDFSPAERYGELVFLTRGMIKPKVSVNQLYRVIMAEMQDSGPDDCLLISSLSILNAVAASIMAHKHGRVNYLIYRGGEYHLSRIVLETSGEGWLEEGINESGR